MVGGHCWVNFGLLQADKSNAQLATGSVAGWLQAGQFTRLFYTLIAARLAFAFSFFFFFFGRLSETSQLVPFCQSSQPVPFASPVNPYHLPVQSTSIVCERTLPFAGVTRLA
jgi:hypothetical protein